MSDPRRLVEDDELARLLLGSAHDDAPSAEGRAKARHAALSAVVGLGAGAAVGLGAGGAKAAGKVASGLALKWLVLASVPVAVVGVGLARLVVHDSPPPLPSVVARVTPGPSHVWTPRAAPSAPLAEASAPVPLPAPELDRPESPKKSGPAISPRPNVSSLQGEITELDAARHALARGDGSVLDHYLAEHPRGALREQALWMKIVSLEQAGRKAEARAWSKRLVASYPNGTFAARARALLGE